MNLSNLHRRPLSDVLAIGTPYPLVVTGGYAVQAHGLVDRLRQITRFRCLALRWTDDLGRRLGGNGRVDGAASC